MFVLSESDTILSASGISKQYPGVVALAGVDFSLRAGEIHALMGENGAGKSTLIRLLTGVERCDSGNILFHGRPFEAKSPQDAQKQGIGAVYQEVNLCPNLSVAENISIGRKIVKNGRIDWRRVNALAVRSLEQLDVHIDVTEPLGGYSVAMQQMVAIARTLNFSSDVLILDEPTSSLSGHEVQQLFDTMRKLKSKGIGIIFITHFIDQVYEVCDVATVLRNGQLVGRYELGKISRAELVGKMIGKELGEFLNMEKRTGKDTAPEGTPLLRTEGLTHNGTIHPFSIEIRRGEVVGLTGLLSSGRSEAAKAVFGIDRPTGGRLEIDGQPVHINSPRTAVRHNLALCPEERKTEGVIAQLSVEDNIVLAIQAKRGLLHRIPSRERRQITEKFTKLLSIKTSGPKQLVGNLSGGNQQKVVLARWLVTAPSLLILDEPTRGIDIGAKAEIQKMVLQLAEQGMSIVFISSELDETLRCCRRAYILKDRYVVGEVEDINMNEQVLMRAIAGEGFQ